ncbi:MAG: cell division protein FtsL [Lachnospiraceae bacterium]|nr:cell division protein FtsL [Lachnospiraceae bacterium]
MAQVRGARGSHKTTNHNAAGSRAAKRRADNMAYMYDNTARQLDVVRQLQEAPKKQLSNETRKNRDKATHMNVGYVFFLACALCVCAVMLMRYVELRSDLTTKVKQVSRLESQLNNLQLANEEDYNRVISSIDLEEIRKIAIGELGMTYAKEGQIIKYEKAGSDYMRRVTE